MRRAARKPSAFNGRDGSTHRVNLRDARPARDQHTIRLPQLFQSNTLIARPFHHRRTTAGDEKDKERARTLSAAQEIKRSTRGFQTFKIRQWVSSGEYTIKVWSLESGVWSQRQKLFLASDSRLQTPDSRPY